MDENPQSYGLPSTLDLYALRAIRSGLKTGSIELSERIIYSIPPWVVSRGDELTIELPPLPMEFECVPSMEYGQPIFPESDWSVNLTFKTIGYGFLRFSEIDLCLDWSQQCVQPEGIPEALIEPSGEQSVTWILKVPTGVEPGNHSGSVNAKFQYLGERGWSEPQSWQLDFQFVVHHPPQRTVTMPTQILTCDEKNCYLIVEEPTGTRTIVTMAKETSTPHEVSLDLAVPTILVLLLVGVAAGIVRWRLGTRTKPT
jgi:hypothetical protein